MNIILLSGGAGKRLWPLSTEDTPKQFLRVLENENGELESMLQRSYRLLKSIDTEANIVIAAPESQASLIREQIGDSARIALEPAKRDTFPAIANAVLYLKDELGVNENDSVVVCPADAFADASYYQAIERLSTMAKTSIGALCLLGVEPTAPTDKYGYILPKNNAILSQVNRFQEKPSVEIAKQLINDGALWNAGVFAFKLKFVVDIIEKQFGLNTHSLFINNYHHLPAISFDYQVVEKAESICVLRFQGKWRDLGSWDELSRVISKKVSHQFESLANNNTTIINVSNVPTVCVGCSDLVIVVSENGVLVSSKEMSSQIKKINNKEI